MNIVISLPYYPKPGTGTGNAVHGFAKGLLSSGANVVVLAEGDEYVDSQYDGVPYIKFSISKRRSPFSVSLELLTYLSNFSSKIDLIILNGIYVPYVYTLAMYSKSIGLPYVHVPHSVYNKVSFTKSRIKKNIYFKIFEKKVLENALVVQMLSGKQIEDLQMLASPKHCIFVPNGVDSTIFNNISNEASFFDIYERGKLRFIFLGRKEVFMKGLDLLIEAFSRLNVKNVELTIQGSSAGDDQKLKKIIKHFKIGNNIKLKDKFEGNIIEYLNNYDVFIMPSRYEAFSMAVLEGMIAKRPIIVSDNVGAASFVKNAKAGIICEPTVDGIHQALHQMICEKHNWHQMGENGNKYLLNNLTWEKIAKNALFTYHKILNEES